jgi:hypothetical protein
MSSELIRVTLHLARSKEFPKGSAAHGYEFVAPLTSMGHLDAEGWRKTKDQCRVRRFWGGEERDVGHLVHRGGAIPALERAGGQVSGGGSSSGGSWAFHYDISGDEEDEAGYRFGAHSFNIGDYVSIRDEDGDLHTFEVAMVEPA